MAIIPPIGEILTHARPPAVKPPLAISDPATASFVKDTLMKHYSFSEPNATLATHLPSEIYDGQMGDQVMFELKGDHQHDTYFSELFNLLDEPGKQPADAHAQAMDAAQKAQPYGPEPHDPDVITERNNGGPEEEFFPPKTKEEWSKYWDKAFTKLDEASTIEGNPKKGVLEWPLHEFALSSSVLLKSEIKALDDKVALGLPLTHDEKTQLSDVLYQNIKAKMADEFGGNISMSDEELGKLIPLEKIDEYDKLLNNAENKIWSGTPLAPSENAIQTVTWGGDDVGPLIHEVPKKAGYLDFPLHEKTLNDTFYSEGEIKGMHDKVVSGQPISTEDYNAIYELMNEDMKHKALAKAGLNPYVHEIGALNSTQYGEYTDKKIKKLVAYSEKVNAVDASKKAHTVKTVSMPRAAAPFDMSGWKQVGEQFGSNPGGLYETPNGQKYYVKFPENEQQARSEVAAGAIYNQMGVNALDTSLVKGPDGKIGIASAWVNDLKEITPGESIKGAQYDYAKQFVAAILTKNWDAIGIGSPYNLTRTAGGEGELMNVDLGGTFKFRAQGEPKDFGPDAAEHDTLLQHEPAASVFRQVPKDYIHDVVQGLHISEHELEDIFEMYGVDDPAGHAQSVMGRLFELRVLYPFTASKKPTFEWYKPSSEALQKVMPPKDFYKNLPDAELFSMAEYAGSSYREMNGYLRGLKDDYAERRVMEFTPKIKYLKKAIDAAPPLPVETMLHRGIDSDTWAGLFRNARPGDNFIDPGFMSTSVSIGTAENFGLGRISIRAPAGSKALVMGPVGLGGEQEILLPPGAKIEVISVDRENRKVVGRYVPQEQVHNSP